MRPARVGQKWEAWFINLALHLASLPQAANRCFKASLGPTPVLGRGAIDANLIASEFTLSTRSGLWAPTALRAVNRRSLML